jgi:hypothetical protein
MGVGAENYRLGESGDENFDNASSDSARYVWPNLAVLCRSAESRDQAAKTVAPRHD